LLRIPKKNLFDLKIFKLLNDNNNNLDYNLVLKNILKTKKKFKISSFVLKKVSSLKYFYSFHNSLNYFFNTKFFFRNYFFNTKNFYFSGISVFKSNNNFFRRSSFLKTTFLKYFSFFSFKMPKKFLHPNYFFNFSNNKFIFFFNRNIFFKRGLKNNKVIFYNFSLNFKNNIFFNRNFFFFFNL
jgi:hypothetical protein